MYDFANILLSGPCNARCPHCIGRALDPTLNVPNLNTFPPRNLGQLVGLVRRHGIRQVVVTGSNTDPQLYRYEGLLLAQLRAALPAGTSLSLHTNGRLALAKMALFNAYDRVSLSLPSLNPAIYERMMGVPGVPDPEAILSQATVPVKLSCLVTDTNAAGVRELLESGRALGIRRVVLRKLYGETRSWRRLLAPEVIGLEPRGSYRDNPVFDYRGVEVTLWDFSQSSSRSLNLFSSGLISAEYLLTAAGERPEREGGQARAGAAVRGSSAFATPG